MRIAFLTTEYPTERLFAGGLASYLRRISLSLVAAGHSVEVFTLSHVRETITDGPIIVHRVMPGNKLTRKIDNLYYIWRYSGYKDVIVPALMLALALYKRHKKAPFEIVQASNYRACGLVAAFLRKIPVITRASSYEPLWRDAYQRELSSTQAQIETAEVMQMRWSAAVYAPSAIISQELREKEGINSEVIEPPVDLSKFDLKDYSCQKDTISGEYALFFGTIGLLKGCDRLVHILPDLLTKNPDMRFAFVGRISRTEDGKSFDEFIKNKLYQFNDRVFVLHEQPHSILLPIVKNAKFVVLPSKIDNLPNACIEAMSLKRVVIGTYDASFDQLIQHGVNGLLVSQNDDNELLYFMHHAWNMSDDERQVMGDAAYRSLLRMSHENAVDQLMGLFQKIQKLRTS